MEEQTPKDTCFIETGLRTQNFLTTFNPTTKWGTHAICSSNEKITHTNSKNQEENNYKFDLNMLIVTY